MPRIIKFEIEVTDEEMSNFLARASGGDGRKVVSQTDATTENEGPAATDAPAVDKNGVAWDARYHASSKALVADGTWRARKGMSDAEKAEADAYNKGGADATFVKDTEAEPNMTTVPSLPVAAPAPSLPVGMPGLPAAAPAPAPVSYEEVVAAYSAAIAKNPALDVPALYAQVGVAANPGILNTPEGAGQRIALKKLFDEESV